MVLSTLAEMMMVLYGKLSSNKAGFKVAPTDFRYHFSKSVGNHRNSKPDSIFLPSLESGFHRSGDFLRDHHGLVKNLY